MGGGQPSPCHGKQASCNDSTSVLRLVTCRGFTPLFLPLVQVRPESRAAEYGALLLQIAKVVRSLGLRYVLEEPACGGLATIDISIRMPDGRKIALEVRLRPK